MSTSDKTPKPVTPSGVTGDTIPPPLTYAEKFDMTMNFVKGVFAGTVHIDFPSIQQMQADPSMAALAKNQGFDEMDAAMAAKLFKAATSRVTEDAQKIYGGIQASEDERKIAVNSLLDWIWRYRCGDRIKGTFLTSPNIETRLSNLESSMEDMRIAVHAFLGP